MFRLPIIIGCCALIVLLSLLSACGAVSLPPATATASPVPRLASPADLDLLQSVITNTAQLTRFHYTLVFTGVMARQPLAIAGDYVAPNMGSATGTEGTQKVEQITIANKSYHRDGTQWIEELIPSNATDPNFTNIALIVQRVNPAKEIQTHLEVDGSVWDTQQVEMMDGAPTRHYTFYLGARVPDPASDHTIDKGDLWIDLTTRQLHRYTFIERQGQRVIFNFITTISRHNDPLITIAPPAN